MKTKHILLILSVFLIGFLFSCSNNSSSTSYDFDSEEAERPEYIKKVINSIKNTNQYNKRTICVSSIVLKVESKNRSAIPSYGTDIIHTISYLEDTVQHPFIFTNGDGDEFILGYEHTDGVNEAVRKLNSNFICYRFDSIYKVIKIDEERNIYVVSSPLKVEQIHNKVLIDMKNGNLYDVADYNLYGTMADDSYIYGGNPDDKCIYKIDTKTLQATPLNSGSRFGLSPTNMSIVNKDYLICKEYEENESDIVFINKNIAPKKIDFINVDKVESNGKVVALEDTYKRSIDNYNGTKTLKFEPIIMKGKDGQLYFFAFGNNYSSALTGKISFEISSSTIVKIKLSDTKTTAIQGEYYSRMLNHPYGSKYSIYSNDCTSCEETSVHGVPSSSIHTYPLKSHGYIFEYEKLVLASHNTNLIKLSIENNKLNVSFPVNKNELYYSPAIYQNDVFYYIHNNEQNIPTLYKYDLNDNSTPTELYNDKDLINKFAISRNRLILHKYINKTDVGIYSFDLATKQIKKIGSNNSQIDNIIEMDF